MCKVTNNKKRILFICLGNICRSPAAHAVMQHLVDEQLPDKRMREHGRRRGYDLNHHARQFDARKDFAYFDLFVVMDEDNYRYITSQAADATARGKVVRMADYFTRHKDATSVPDPYYGGPEDFELALDLIEDGCEGLI